GLNYFSFCPIQLLQTRINPVFLEIVQGHSDENVAVFRFRDPEPVVELLQLRVMLQCGPDEAETFGAAAFDDGGEQQAVEKSIERVGAAKLEQRLDVGVFAHFFGQDR